MDNPNITMEEYIRLQEEKALRHGRTFNWQTATYGKVKYCENEDDCFTNSETEFPALVFDDTLTSDATLSFEPMSSETPVARYQVEGYTEDIVYDFEQRLDTIFSRQVNRVYVLDFVRLIAEMRGTLADRLRMVYTGDEGRDLFTTHAWRRLFEIRGPLIREFILEFFSTCRMSDTEMGLYVADTLCFQLGGARRRMTWTQFILALGLHTAKEMAEDGFEAYWLGSTRAILDKRDLKD
ncbi:hypothetical protein Tco_0994952 [Tanacetum coccineum]